MIDRRHLHARLQEANAVRLQRHHQEIEIRRITEQRLMHAHLIRHLAVGAQPHLTLRLRRVAFQRVVKLHRADLQRLIAQEFVFHLRRQKVRQRSGDLRFRFQPVRRGRRRHRFLMFEAAFRCLERRGHIENRLTVLDSRHAPGAEAIAVAQHFHVINNGFLAVAGAQKIAVKRVDETLFRHRRFSGVKRLADDLAAEHLS